MEHVPVFTEEVIRHLNLQSGRHYIDATADGGGHAVQIIRLVQPTGKLLAVEWDEELYEILAQRLKTECSRFSKNYVLRRASYTDLAGLVRSLSFRPVKGVLFDFGMSSFHLEASRRGFSFQRDEPLDMRYSRKDLGETAADILNRRTPDEIEEILKIYGGERFARAIARRIVLARRHRPIRQTSELVAIIRSAVPLHSRRGRIHFATRTFQALRIAVNHEFENIERGLRAAAGVLAPGGRIITISFHYPEDAIVKRFFRDAGMRVRFTPLLARPLAPSRQEIISNPRARSARLRAYEKIS